MNDTQTNELSELKKSRSGRILIPRLKLWTGERAVVSKRGVEVVDGSPDCTSTFESERNLFKGVTWFALSQIANVPSVLPQVKVSKRLTESPLCGTPKRAKKLKIGRPPHSETPSRTAAYRPSSYPERPASISSVRSPRNASAKHRTSSQSDSSKTVPETNKPNLLPRGDGGRAPVATNTNTVDRTPTRSRGASLKANRPRIVMHSPSPTREKAKPTSNGQSFQAGSSRNISQDRIFHELALSPSPLRVRRSRGASLRASPSRRSETLSDRQSPKDPSTPGNPIKHVCREAECAVALGRTMPNRNSSSRFPVVVPTRVSVHSREVEWPHYEEPRRTPKKRFRIVNSSAETKPTATTSPTWSTSPPNDVCREYDLTLPPSENLTGTWMDSAGSVPEIQRSRSLTHKKRFKILTSADQIAPITPTRAKSPVGQLIRRDYWSPSQTKNPIAAQRHTSLPSCRMSGDQSITKASPSNTSPVAGNTQNSRSPNVLPTRISSRLHKAALQKIQHDPPDTSPGKRGMASDSEAHSPVQTRTRPSRSPHKEVVVEKKSPARRSQRLSASVHRRSVDINIFGPEFQPVVLLQKLDLDKFFQNAKGQKAAKRERPSVLEAKSSVRVRGKRKSSTGLENLASYKKRRPTGASKTCPPPSNRKKLAPATSSECVGKRSSTKKRNHPLLKDKGLPKPDALELNAATTPASKKSAVRWPRTVKETQELLRVLNQTARVAEENEEAATAGFFRQMDGALRPLPKALDDLGDMFDEGDDNLSIRTMRESSPVSSAVSPVGSLHETDSEYSENENDALLRRSPKPHDPSSFHQAKLLHRVVTDKRKLMRNASKSEKKDAESSSCRKPTVTNSTPEACQLLNPRRMRAMEKAIVNKTKNLNSFDFSTYYNGNLLHVSVNPDSESEESSVDSLDGS